MIFGRRSRGHRAVLQDEVASFCSLTMNGACVVTSDAGETLVRAAATTGSLEWNLLRHLLSGWLVSLTQSV